MNRQPIGYVVATVRVPVYEGDRREVGQWFEYSEPGATATGQLGTIRRECQLIDQNFAALEPTPAASRG